MKVWFSRNNQLLHRITMPHKIKNAVKKIDEFEKEGSRRLNLLRQESRGGGRRNNETYAANNGDGLKTGMVGRDIEKEKIISLVSYQAGSRHWSAAAGHWCHRGD